MSNTNDPTEPPRSRIAGTVGGVWAAFMGVLPHVLHHVGPLAGAAFIAGTTGTVLFGLLAFVFTVPLLLRVRRRCHSWRIPALLLAGFIAVWSLSTWVVGPWVNDQLTDDPPAAQQDDPTDEAEHEQHHVDEDS